MDYKLLKLKIKRTLMNSFRTFQNDAIINDFTSEAIKSPSILIIFPIQTNLISESMDAISEVVSAHEHNDSSFTFIIDKNRASMINFFDIQTIPVEIKKEKFLLDSNMIFKKIETQSFDIILNLNIKFNLGVDALVEKINAKYKIGFISKYSDLFYNIQLNWDESGSRFSSIVNILGEAQ